MWMLLIIGFFLGLILGHKWGFTRGREFALFACSVGRPAKPDRYELMAREMLKEAHQKVA